MVKPEIFLLTFCPLTPSLSPHWGEGKGEGKFQLFLARFLFERRVLMVSKRMNEKGNKS